jgi:hypothetical protein
MECWHPAIQIMYKCVLVYICILVLNLYLYFRIPESMGSLFINGLYLVIALGLNVYTVHINGYVEFFFLIIIMLNIVDSIL